MLIAAGWPRSCRCFGRTSAAGACSAALAPAVHLGLTAAVVIPTVSPAGRSGTVAGRFDVHRVSAFRPEFVPGDPGLARRYDTGPSSTPVGLTATPAGTAGPNVQFFLGVDGLNIWLVALASLMLIPAILVSWESVKERPGAFYGWLFLLQARCDRRVPVVRRDPLLRLLRADADPGVLPDRPLGHRLGRRDAARKFFLYTLAGSLLTLLGVIGVVLTNPNPKTGQITFSLPDLMANVQTGMLAAHSGEHLAGQPEKLTAKQSTQFWLFVALMAGFMVKVPVWPFHTWLPAAYGESPDRRDDPALGAAGEARHVRHPAVRAAAHARTRRVAYGLPVVGTLAAFGIVYAALCAYDQKDIKLMIAYSSVSHLGFLVLGLFAFNARGAVGRGAAHGQPRALAPGRCSRCWRSSLDRYRTTRLRPVRRADGRFPEFAFLTFVLCLASIGLPGLNNFVSEMLMLAGLFDARQPAASIGWGWRSSRRSASC